MYEDIIKTSYLLAFLYIIGIKSSYESPLGSLSHHYIGTHYIVLQISTYKYLMVNIHIHIRYLPVIMHDAMMYTHSAPIVYTIFI